MGENSLTPPAHNHRSAPSEMFSIIKQQHIKPVFNSPMSLHPKTAAVCWLRIQRIYFRMKTIMLLSC